MMTLQAAAKAAHERRERDKEEERQEWEQQRCAVALREAYQAFGFHPESAVYNRSAKRVELAFDKGAVRIARCFEGRFEGSEVWEWRVLFECGRCGELVAYHQVTDLADVGYALADGPDWMDGHHRCLAREGKSLSDYLVAESVA